MKKLDSAELWLLKKAVECKMKSLKEIMKEKSSYSDSIMDFYGDYSVLLAKLDMIEIEYKKDLFSK